MNIIKVVIVVLIIILVSHLLCGCHNNPYSIIEGLTSAVTSTPPSVDTTAIVTTDKKPTTATATDTATPSTTTATATPSTTTATATPSTTTATATPSTTTATATAIPSATESFTNYNSSNYADNAELINATYSHKNSDINTMNFFKGSVSNENSCKYSPYSDSTGCLTLSNKQIQMLATRGGNATFYTDF